MGFSDYGLVVRYCGSFWVVVRFLIIRCFDCRLNVGGVVVDNLFVLGFEFWFCLVWGVEERGVSIEFLFMLFYVKL